MKKRNSRKRAARLSRRGLRAVAALALILMLVASYAALAQRQKVRTANKPISRQAEGAAISPANLTPSTPSKEFMYVGGKLVAIEEPGP